MSTELAALYRDLHHHPELGFAEHRTARIVADRLRADGFDVLEGIGGTGVVGMLRRGDGPVVLLRADMDALPVAEQTGLDYASTQTARPLHAGSDAEEVPVMHACGHDMHVTCLLGAAEVLAADHTGWSGTLLTVFQPAEELGAGARAMVADGLYDRVPRPSVVLGQHVGPLPAGILALRAGTAFAASDTIRVVLHGRGAHASRPQTAVDPVVLAAATVLRLQTVVSRELDPTQVAVLTVGSLHAGTAPNIIADRAELMLSLRTTDASVRARALATIERIVRGEAEAAGAPRAPEVDVIESFPVLHNDEAAAERTRGLLGQLGVPVVDPGLVTGSEDVGLLASAVDAPCVYWLLGGADPASFQGATDVEGIRARMDTLPSNHSPFYAPVIEPTLSLGIRALVTAARGWLGAGSGD